MDKRSLSEREICTRFITPALHKAGWDQEQIREEVSFTAGRIIVRGKVVARGPKKRADYVLYWKPNVPLAVIEAKANKHSVGHGMQQALAYAEALEAPFVFSSNGDGFVFHDRTGESMPRETNLALDSFPSPEDLWSRYRRWKDLTPEQEETVLQDYHDDGVKKPRYYQVNAINAAVEAIAKGQDRVLLVMATGTGKTYTAFQIIWRLWKAKRKKRVLFLADRNVLVDQTKVNDFRPFGEAMTKLSTSTGTIKRNDKGEVKVDPAYEVYLSLYQAITGPEDGDKHYRSFSPEFFDLIVIDECHRGSADRDSAWREILDYFSSATQIGLTATPKETRYASNIHYFGDPVYSYSLKQGIQDGFLAPYKVVRVHIDRDIEGYRPESGKRDRDGEEIPDQIYNTRDFDRTIVIDGRTNVVAEKVTQFLDESEDRFQKAIVFCVDQEHADRMRQALVNENSNVVAKHPRYIMRITGNDPEGQNELGNFIDPETKTPVVATTSRLLSTGVDVPTCQLIVLDRKVDSMTEFKQIVGRGTRVHEDSHKYYFTLIDFRGATRHFADPDFDGEPVQIYEPKGDQPIDPPSPPPPPQPGTPTGDTPDVPAHVVFDPAQKNDEPAAAKKIYADNVSASIVREREQYLDADGRLMTESLRVHTRNTLRQTFISLDHFLKRWNAADRKQAILDEVGDVRLSLEALRSELGDNLDLFDLICHVAFDAKPLTRRERADGVRKRDVFTKYGPQARAVLDALLEKYANDGVLDIGDVNVLKLPPLNTLGTPLELVGVFGRKSAFENAVRELQAALYREVA